MTVGGQDEYAAERHKERFHHGEHGEHAEMMRFFALLRMTFSLSLLLFSALPPPSSAPSAVQIPFLGQMCSRMYSRFRGNDKEEVVRATCVICVLITPLA